MPIFMDFRQVKLFDWWSLWLTSWSKLIEALKWEIIHKVLTPLLDYNTFFFFWLKNYFCNEWSDTDDLINNKWPIVICLAIASLHKMDARSICKIETRIKMLIVALLTFSSRIAQMVNFSFVILSTGSYFQYSVSVNQKRILQDTTRYICKPGGLWCCCFSSPLLSSLFSVLTMSPTSFSVCVCVLFWGVFFVLTLVSVCPWDVVMHCLDDLCSQNLWGSD